MSTTTTSTHLDGHRLTEAAAVDLLTEPFRARTWREVGYVLASLPVSVITFGLAAVGLALGLGLSVTLVGIPLLLATLWSADQGARFERWRTGWVGANTHRGSVHGSVVVLPWSPSGVRARLARASGWKRVGYFVALLPLSVVTFTVVVTAWSFGVAAVTIPFWNWAVAHGSARLLGYVATRPIDYVPIVGAGLAMLLASPWLTRAAARAHLALARLLTA